ncbi:MAG: hypothetical protein WCF84_08385 [Anaerolineae bacterium]
MQKRARLYLTTCQAEHPQGAFRFWGRDGPHHAAPDMDDTALAHLALGRLSPLSSTDALALFGPYRTTSGCPLHPISRWAGVHKGVFTVWMDEGPAIVDACACANVVRFLGQAGARDVPGYIASLKMLTDLVATGETRGDWTPYYSSPYATAFFCSRLNPSGQDRIAEENALLQAVKIGVEKSCTRPEPAGFNRMLLVSAGLSTGVAPDAGTIEQVCQGQCADGGWPASVICQGLRGEPRWSSRAVTTALACEILVRLERGCDTTC